MHLHSYRYMTVSTIRSLIVGILSRGEPIPSLLEMKATEAGINVDALREQFS